MSKSVLPKRTASHSDDPERGHDDLERAHQQPVPAVINSKEREPSTETHGDRSSNDGDEFHKIIVGWNTHEDCEHPYNLPRWRINATAALLAMLAFLVPFSSAIMSPATSQMMEDFNSSSELLQAFMVSVFVLGNAFGPLIWAPLSEIYGRFYIYHGTNVAFVALTVGCALAPSLSVLIALRFLAGLFGGAVLANGGASIADMMPPAKRGLFMGLFILGPVMGPAVGPICGGFLSTAKGWRWVFWLVAILAGFVTIMMALVTRETYAPVLLQRKLEHLRQATGIPGVGLGRSRDMETISWRTILWQGIIRPMKLLVTSPISALCALNMAVAYGILNLLITSISIVYQETYSWSANISGLAFIGLGCGTFSGTMIISGTSDKYGASAAAKDGSGQRKPEYRLFLLPFGGLLLPAGLFIFGWTAEYKVHWIVPMIGEALIGVGIMIIFMSTTLYLIESYAMYAASALAANGFMRSIGGGLLPLAGLTMYSNLGVGWGNSVLAFIALLIPPISLVLQWYGEKLRKNYEPKIL
ncbi:bicyclomycin resistance protein [Talaromyces proteolyticus]|uniref:Bicyclomycin resistance protein n=1 Tax=Talaromyces proteolyticus TaxID=1131652 RepID=A0AAD4L186_9EURO|nr:bicyclomycin resistance protein [Talaromyces proteolyticus]KAH8701039.1 bicyclomycin resistance protein [Talaromyces proteolyticus]